MLEAQCRKGDDIHNFVIWAKSAVLVEKEIERTMGFAGKDLENECQGQTPPA